MAHPTKRHFRTLHRSPIAAAAWLAATHVFAQTAPETQLAPVVISGRATPTASVAGWGDAPLASTPVQASVYSTEQLRDRGAQRLADVTASDAGVSDAYNTEGYWDYLTVRGFVLDNRFNFRRDGLPINAQTTIPLDNKARIEILKGTSGMQAGTSAPGGLVNFVVKRPVETPLRSVGIEWRERGSVTGNVDLGQRFGTDKAFGLRLNATAARLDPKVRDTKGERALLAVAGDWRLSPDTLLEAEFETSRRSQPSVPGFSLLGDTVPAPVDPRISLNNQPWSLPVVMDATTASLRWQQRLSNDWRFVAHAASQRLKTDDRIAFPFGCFSPDPAPDGTYYADRYCPDGTFDLYDFRSENERRRTDAVDLALHGRVKTGAIEHALVLGGLHSKVRDRFQRQAYNYAGVGNVDGTLVTPAAPELTDENTNRDERSTELYLRDAIRFGPAVTAWLGVRHTRIERQSVRTDGSRATDYTQRFTTPFAALSVTVAEQQMVYASWGRGVESEVVTNRPRFRNAGEALSARSRQAEIGWKGATEQAEWSLAAFDIERQAYADIGPCDDDATCTREADGTQRHRGIEASGALRAGAWTLRGGAMWLRARREGSQDAAISGREPTNVPARTLKLQAQHAVAALPGLDVLAGLVHESRRMVLPDNSVSIPGWTRLDLAARYDVRLAGGTNLTWRLGIDNLTDRRAWRESPYQFGHAYLFPLAPRTFRLSLQAEL